MNGDCRRSARLDEEKKVTGHTHLLAQLHILHDFQRECEIAEESMNAQQSDDAEVTEHAVERTNTVFPHNFTVETVRINTIDANTQERTQSPLVFCLLEQQ